MVQMPDALAIIEKWTQDRERRRYVVVTGMHGVMEAQKDPAFKAIINEADLFVPDGISLVWAARLRGRWLKHRVTGSDLMWQFLQLSAQKGYRNFFYGDTPETLEQLVTKLKDKLPELEICGVYSPPFRPATPEESRQDAKMINDSKADVVWVGLGLPKQERWMVEHRDVLEAPVVIGVGAAFKFLSGQASRAPNWVGDNGFEWMWRLLHEPRRVWRRALLDGPQFVWQLGLEVSRLKKFD